MRGQGLAKRVAAIPILALAGCCTWCHNHCPQPVAAAPACYPAPAACCPAPAPSCCPAPSYNSPAPACAPAAAGYPAQPAGWQRSYDPNACCH